MLTVGPRSTLAPLPHCSAPITPPYCLTSDGSQLAAPATGPGSCGTPVIRSATPAGPSSSQSAGTQSDGMAGMLPTYGPLVPCTIWIFWSRVILARTSAARVAAGAFEPTQGHAGLLPAVLAVAAWAVRPLVAARAGGRGGGGGAASHGGDRGGAGRGGGRRGRGQGDRGGDGRRDQAQHPACSRARG